MFTHRLKDKERKQRIFGNKILTKKMLEKITQQYLLNLYVNLWGCECTKKYDGENNVQQFFTTKQNTSNIYCYYYYYHSIVRCERNVNSETIHNYILYIYIIFEIFD